jgi:GntR family transcriptional regulator
MPGKPIYQVIKDELKTAILAGELPYGRRVPSEMELCRQYDVSRISTKRALSDLEREGLVVRKPGRGTFVSYSPIDHRIAGYYSLDSEILRNGRTPHSELVLFEEQTVAQANPFDAIGLRRFLLLGDADRVYHIVCRRYQNDELIALDNTYLAAARCPRPVTAEDLTGESTLYQLVEKEFALGPITAQEHYFARTINEQEAEFLDAGCGSPALKVLRVCQVSGGPIIYNYRVYKGEKMHLYADLGQRPQCP